MVAFGSLFYCHGRLIVLVLYYKRLKCVGVVVVGVLVVGVVVVVVGVCLP